MKDITQITCCSCGTVFGVSDVLIELRRNDGKGFFCPNGHEQQFSNSNKSQLEEAKKKLKELEEELTETKAEIRSLKCELLKKENSEASTFKWPWK